MAQRYKLNLVVPILAADICITGSVDTSIDIKTACSLVVSILVSTLKEINHFYSAVSKLAIPQNLTQICPTPT